MKQYGALDDTFYMWFGANDTSGSGGDGASPAADVRLAGAAADAAPVYSPTPSLLSHVNYPAGAYEIAITASAGNGFAANNTYAVFCTLAIDSQNPTGFVGSFDLKPVESNVAQWLDTAAATPTIAGVPEVDLTHIGGVAQSATDLKDMVDTGYDPANHKIQSDLIYIHGSALTETAGQLAAAFTKLFDVASPLLVASEVMRGTDSAYTGTPPTAAAIVNEWESQSQADPTGFHVNVKEVNGTAQTANDNGADINAILLDTGTDGVVVASGSKTGYALTATGANLILKNSTFALAIADAICDEVLTGATHNVTNSLGRRIREIGAYAIHSGTAQAGANVSITLAATASAIDGTYNRNLLVLTDSTGAGQTRTIVDYVGSTKIAIIDREWRTNPDATSEYQVVPDDTPLVVDQGVAQAGSTSTTIKLRAYASATNDIYLCNIVILVAGTGRGQARLVGGYNGTTKVITLCGDDWTTTPDDTSVYVMIPYGATCTSCVNDDALAQINTEMDSVLNTAIPGSPTANSINEKIKDLPSGIAKNVALPKFDLYMVLSSDHVTAATGKTVTGQISKDGGAFAGITNAITEVSNGMYKIASGFTQAEMNADVITLKFTETDCDQRMITIHTT